MNTVMFAYLFFLATLLLEKQAGIGYEYKHDLVIYFHYFLILPSCVSLSEKTQGFLVAPMPTVVLTSYLNCKKLTPLGTVTSVLLVFEHLLILLFALVFWAYWRAIVDSSDTLREILRYRNHFQATITQSYSTYHDQWQHQINRLTEKNMKKH